MMGRNKTKHEEGYLLRLAATMVELSLRDRPVDVGTDSAGSATIKPDSCPPDARSPLAEASASVGDDIKTADRSGSQRVSAKRTTTVAKIHLSNRHQIVKPLAWLWTLAESQLVGTGWIIKQPCHPSTGLAMFLLMLPAIRKVDKPFALLSSHMRHIPQLTVKQS